MPGIEESRVDSSDPSDPSLRTPAAAPLVGAMFTPAWSGAAYLLSFGGITLPATLHVAMNPTNRQVTATKLPRRDGARLQSGGLTEKRFTVQGGIVASSPGLLRGLLDALQAALAAGPANFTTENDRFYRGCYVQNYSDSYDPTSWNYYTTVHFEVIAGDPFSYEMAVQTAAQAAPANPQPLNYANNGTAPALPQLALTASATGPINLMIATGGLSCSVVGNVNAGDVIVIDSLAESVTIGGADRMSLFDGMFPALLPGANTLTVSGGGLSNISLNWQSRYF